MEGTFYGQDNRGIPVLTYEELAGLVLGYDPWELGMQMHQVAVEPLLDKMGVQYDPSAKYLGKMENTSGNRPPRRSEATRKTYCNGLWEKGNYHRRRRRRMQTAITLSKLGISPVIIERGDDRRQVEPLGPALSDHDPRERSTRIASRTGRRFRRRNPHVLEVKEIGQEEVKRNAERRHPGFAPTRWSSLRDFDLFPAELKEEYGYKIYDNVYTTVDVERMFRNGGIRTADGRIPKTIAFLHCVGSRDEKVNQRHCSRVCCITGVKQAIEMKQAIPRRRGIQLLHGHANVRPRLRGTLPAGAAGVQYPFHPAAASPRRAKRSTTECRSRPKTR